MFYINSRKLRDADALISHLIPALIVFIAFSGIAILNWRSSIASVRSEQIKSLERNNSLVSSAITNRLRTYEDILRGGSSLMSSGSKIDEDTWSKYVNSFEIEKRYPGLQGVGYAELNSKGQDKQIKVMFIEPKNQRNTNIIGSNMYVDDDRRHAMDEAVESAEPVLTNTLTLLGEKDAKDKQPGFLMYMPVYKNSQIPTSIEARRQNLAGYTYAPFRSYDFIDSTLTSLNKEYAFSLENLNDEKHEEIYKSSNFDEIKENNSSIIQEQKIALQGTSWKLIGISSVNIVSGNILYRRNSILFGGLLFSVLASASIYLILLNRTRTLAAKEEKGVQQAKDELLALASHQLRTPATGVKQYVGMLRQGFAGKLTPTQKKLLDKAYDSNERQLGTINEMLFVARADAGFLNMEKQKVNISEMVESIVEEQAGTIKSNGQEYEVKLPKKNVYLNGDPQYLRMAFENIISNATKYTKKGGFIKIRLTNSLDNVRFVVSDTGVGVAAEDMKHLFEKFSRIPNELTSQVSGTGIGLYLTKKVIKAHKGTISFRSEVGVGSVVTISLPKLKNVIS